MTPISKDPVQAFVDDVERLLPVSPVWGDRYVFESAALTEPSDAPRLVVRFSSADAEEGRYFAFDWKIELDDPDYAVFAANLDEALHRSLWPRGRVDDAGVVWLRPFE